MRRVRRQDAASGSTASTTSSNVASTSSTDNLVSPTTTTPTTTQNGSPTSNTSTTPTTSNTSSSSSSSSNGFTSGSSIPTPPPDQRNNDIPNTTDESITQVFTSMSGTRVVTVTAVIPNPSASLQHSGGPVSFWDNRGAVIATFTLVGIAVVAILGVAITASFRRKRRNRGGSSGEIPRDSHFLDDDDNDSRFYQALSEKSGASGISPAAASFSEKWGSGPTRHPYASPPVGADLRRTIVELPVEPISRPPSAFLSLHPSTRPTSLMPDPSMFQPGPRSGSDDHHLIVRPDSAAWDHPNNPGHHPFSGGQLNRSPSQNRSLPTLPDQPLHQHAPALQHSRQFSDPQLLNRMSQMVPDSSPNPPPPSPNAIRHTSFGADAMLGLSADPNALPLNRHHSLGAASLLMPMSSRTPSPQPSNYDASMYSRTPGSSADYGTRRRGTGDWSAPGFGHSPSQSIGSNYTYMPPPPPANGYERTRDPRFSAAFGATPTPSRSGVSLAHSGASASLGQVQQAYYAHPQYAHPQYVPPPHDPRYSGMMMGGGRRPGTGSSASVAYTYQPQRPPTSQSFYSKKTISRPGTGESDTTTSSEQQQIQYLHHPEDVSIASSVTTHVDDLEPRPAVSATSLQTTTTETRAEGSRSGKAERVERSKAEGSGPPLLYLPDDVQHKDISDATSLKDDVDYTPGWIGSLLIANE